MELDGRLPKPVGLVFIYRETASGGCSSENTEQRD